MNPQLPSNNDLLLTNNQNLSKTSSMEELNKMRSEINDNNISTELCYGVGCGSAANVEDIDGVPMASGASSSTCQIS